ncbi:hypothetical protein [Marinobacter mobilis]|uniref:Uncharacterized protein n=1 Tax=Marinobacter mobilis TaxID=488533 RepID=A0A1H3CDI6_9GAMM|nr:hypothetical protein [Marinobacter mobilis]SDW74538.1 hypothetical protein SAMN04487960_10428 [Marinobacter mobilis]SDX51978.1 hypothetical protein SAMN04487960_110127 [Marinobacter mobilis]
MSHGLWVVLVVVVMAVGVIWYQKTRTDRTLQALTEKGFEVSRQWRSNVLVVADDSRRQLAIVWPQRYTIVDATALTGVEVTEQELEASRHRYNLVLTFDHPEVQRVGLALNNRGDRARAWAAEIEQWRAGGR